MTATTPEAVRDALRSGDELAVLDVRPEARFATGHPLFAASMPLDRLELEVVDRIPRLSTPLFLYGDADYRAEAAVARLRRLGYQRAALLDGGLAGWTRSGGELFRDVNVPSKAFGELVAERLGTPLIDPITLRGLIDQRKAIVLDARPLDEFHTMSIPTGQSAPGATLVRQAAGLDAGDLLVVVSCAGRTRSIIGAQSIIHAGVVGRAAALRNGTIGWTLAGLELEHGQRDAAGPVAADALLRAAAAARRVAARAGVRRVGMAGLAELLAGERTVYRFDVRLPEEFAVGHLPGFRSAPGGQLLQETDRYAPVRGAVIVLADDDGPEADMTASWLAQMGWRVFVLSGVRSGDGTASGPDRPARPARPAIAWTEPEGARRLLDTGWAAVDVGTHRSYLTGHLPGSRWASRTLLVERADRLLPEGVAAVVVSDDDTLTALAAHELGAAPRHVVGLAGGVEAWRKAGFGVERGVGAALSPPEDRYVRPYEGTDVDPDRMQAYLDWEYGLVEQLRRDGTHRFAVLATGKADITSLPT